MATLKIDFKKLNWQEFLKEQQWYYLTHSWEDKGYS